MTHAVGKTMVLRYQAVARANPRLLILSVKSKAQLETNHKLEIVEWRFSHVGVNSREGFFI